MCKCKITRPRVTHRVKNLRKVLQQDEEGCFVAALATCLGVTYSDALNIVHPRNPHSYGYNSFWERYRSHGLHPFRAYELAAKHLRAFREAKERHFKDFTDNALVTIRWREDPYLSHAVVWDFKRKRIIDPLRRPHTYEELDSQIFRAHYFKRPIVQAKE